MISPQQLLKSLRSRSSQLLNSSRKAVASRPKWQLYVAGGVIAVAGAYLLWCRFAPQPKPQKEFASAVAAKPVADMPKVAVAGPKRLYVYPKQEAGEKLGISAAAAADPHVQIGDAVDVKPGPKAAGSRVVTFVNISTGQIRSEVKDIPRPWASFERNNALGIGYGWSSQRGQLYALRYSRDVARVSSGYFHGELETNFAPNSPPREQLEIKGMVWGTWRW